MHIQPDQLITLIVYVSLIVGAYKAKWLWLRMLLIGSIFVLFTVNPVVNNIKGGASLESSSNNVTKELPKRITVKKQSFEDTQSSELRKMQTQSKEYYEETN